MSNDKFDTARQVLRQQKLTGERALFQSENLAIYDSVFEDGEWMVEIDFWYATEEAAKLTATIISSIHE